MPTTMLVFCLGLVPRYIDLQLIFTKQFQDLDGWVWISIFYICMNPGTQSQQETRGTFNGWCLCSWACCLGMMVQGLRVAMPLTRIALQSPAGAARGQVLFLSICPFLHLRWDIWCVSKAMAKRVLKSAQSLSVHWDPCRPNPWRISVVGAQVNADRESHNFCALLLLSCHSWWSDGLTLCDQLS